MWYKYLFFYFLISSIVAALIVADELAEEKERWLYVIFLTIGGPLIGLLFALKNAWNWIDAQTQAKTFIFFIFNKKALIRTREGLEYIEKIGKGKRSGNRLRDRLYRKAVNLIFKVNNYVPNGSSTYEEDSSSN